MSKDYIIKVINPDQPKLGTRLTSWRCEDFLRGVIEMSREGYELRAGEVFSSLTGYSAHFDAPEVEKVTDNTPPKIMGVINMDITGARKISTDKVDVERIAAMEGDKGLLDKYGEELGVKLNRSKTFKNMLKDLDKGLS